MLNVEVRSAELFIAALFIVELRRLELFIVLETMRSPKSEETRICGVTGRGALDHVVRTGEGFALWSCSRTWNHGYVRVLAPQIWESSLRWRMATIIKSRK